MKSEMENATPSSFQQQSRAFLETLEWQVIVQTNRRLPDSVFYPLLVAYTVVIVFGILANVFLIILIRHQRSRSFPSIIT